MGYSPQNLFKFRVLLQFTMVGNDISYKADEYSETKKRARFRDAIEHYTIFHLLENTSGLKIRGSKILDAGCGDGIYSRELIDRGAAYVIGVDGAEDFIELAKKKNKGYEDKIEYHKSFIQDFPGIENLDLVVGSYILSYPRNLEEAVDYCSAMASHLKRGGKFIGFNNNPFDVFEGQKYSKYAFTKVMINSKEGSPVNYWIEGMVNPIVNYYLKPETYEEAFKLAGFSEFEWKRVLLDSNEHKDPYWEEFFEGHPDFPSPFIAMIAKK